MHLSGDGLEAVYLDNEGNVIEYFAEASPDGRRVVLVGKTELAMPTFRSTYARVDKDLVDVTFELAPPGSPNRFTPYVSGRVRRPTR